MKSPPSTGATLHPGFRTSRELARPTISSRGVKFRFGATQGEPGSLSAPLRRHFSGSRAVSTRCTAKLSSENVAALCIEADTALLLGDTLGAKLSKPCAIEDVTSQRPRRGTNVVDAALTSLTRVGLHHEGHGPQQQSNSVCE